MYDYKHNRIHECLSLLLIFTLSYFAFYLGVHQLRLSTKKRNPKGFSVLRNFLLGKVNEISFCFMSLLITKLFFGMYLLMDTREKYFNFVAEKYKKLF